jgi:hypothetical protein
MGRFRPSRPVSPTSRCPHSPESNLVLERPRDGAKRQKRSSASRRCPTYAVVSLPSSCLAYESYFMKLFYPPGSSSLLPHIVLHEAELAFQPVRINEHTRAISGGVATIGA